jgi:hypothetical protein
MSYILDFYWLQDVHRSLEFGGANCNPLVEDLPRLMMMDGDLRCLRLMQLLTLPLLGLQILKGPHSSVQLVFHFHAVWQNPSNQLDEWADHVLHPRRLNYRL